MRMDPRTTNRLRQQLARAREQALSRHVEHLRGEILSTLAAQPGLRADVYLIGSWATGEFDGASDTDLLAIVERPEQIDETERRLMAIGDDVIALTDQQWQRRLASNPGFYQRIASQRKQLVARDEVTGDE